ncbi:MAG: sigma-54-dependent Fis family transcriptional regulator [Pirellulaceae bacterium]|nr:sigma-54-dependent Fis family transcriptional regulator [Pirellulaceae bacterium]
MALVSQLRMILGREFGCMVESVSGLGAIEELLAAGDLPTIFVLPEHCTPETLAEFERIAAQSGPPVPLIALTIRGEPVPGTPGSPFHGTLELPLDRERLLALFTQQLGHHLFAGAGDPPEPLVCNFKEFSYRTYSREFHQTLTHLSAVAKHDVTLLLVGETGTGKTTMARLIHEMSGRSSHALLTVACGALPAELIESELFGHVKGAFTGADYNKIGRFAAAGHGTLLLDEIDVLSPHQQARLLRVIESGEYEPVGSHKTQMSQARLIVATNENLSALMERNEFRSDLYYRLNVLEFNIPPLRKRRLDVIPLTLGFVDEFCSSHDITVRRIHPEFLACLLGYHWPGNIRELKNHIRRAVLFSRHGELTAYDLASDVFRAGRQAMLARNSRAPETLSEKVACSEQEILEAALRDNNYKRSATAAALGISRVGLYKKMKKYGMLDRKSPDA